MDRIETKILNPSAIAEAEQMTVFAARLTQKGHDIQNMADLMCLYMKAYKDETVKNLTTLPHPTIQKFAIINVAIVGASRRFLAQITRHQNEVKFMSASLQYSDYSGKARFVVPYEIIGTDKEAGYLAQCEASMQKYMSMITTGVSNDDAGYIAPQALRNVLLIGATPYQWKHMIHQRTCRRNSPETRYVMLRVWQALHKESPELFSKCGPFCMKPGVMGGLCEEGNMSCGTPLSPWMNPSDVLELEFPKLC